LIGLWVVGETELLSGFLNLALDWDSSVIELVPLGLGEFTSPDLDCCIHLLVGTIPPGSCAMELVLLSWQFDPHFCVRRCF
jgi:hypothetical protein